jgi:hypothetical protein
LQQNPSTQLPDWHCPPDWHAVPLACGVTQAPPTQNNPWAQPCEVPSTQLPSQVPAALHPKGAQEVTEPAQPPSTQP